MRMVEQNEFLDIILTVDTSSLRRQLEEEPTPPSTAAMQTGVNAVKVGLMRPPPLSSKGTGTTENVSQISLTELTLSQLPWTLGMTMLQWTTLQSLYLLKSRELPKPHGGGEQG